MAYGFNENKTKSKNIEIVNFAARTTGTVAANSEGTLAGNDAAKERITELINAGYTLIATSRVYHLTTGLVLCSIDLGNSASAPSEYNVYVTWRNVTNSAKTVNYGGVGLTFAKFPEE